MSTNNTNPDVALPTSPPWEWRFFGNVTALVGAHSMFPIVLDCTPKGVLRVRENGRMRAVTLADFKFHPDLRLIAAAPDLLAACKALMTLADQWNPYIHDDAGGTMAAARAAIAKAQGGAS